VTQPAHDGVSCRRLRCASSHLAAEASPPHGALAAASSRERRRPFHHDTTALSFDFSAAVELRKMFPGIADTNRAGSACAPWPAETFVHTERQGAASSYKGR
jgi:hypothetical protein